MVFRQPFLPPVSTLFMIRTCLGCPICCHHMVKQPAPTSVEYRMRFDNDHRTDMNVPALFSESASSSCHGAFLSPAAIYRGVWIISKVVNKELPRELTTRLHADRSQPPSTVCGGSSVKYGDRLPQSGFVCCTRSDGPVSASTAEPSF